MAESHAQASSKEALTRIDAVIFDMDGTIVRSRKPEVVFYFTERLVDLIHIYKPQDYPGR